MPSVMTLLLAAFIMHDATSADTISNTAVLQTSDFCAEVQPFTAFTVADGDELPDGDEFGAFADDMGCADGNEPLDVDVEVDAV